LDQFNALFAGVSLHAARPEQTRRACALLLLCVLETNTHIYETRPGIQLDMYGRVEKGCQPALGKGMDGVADAKPKLCVKTLVVGAFLSLWKFCV
jgi:hypothetical protein